jgi:hypothetical protein
MSLIAQTEVMHRLLEPLAQCLTYGVARRIAGLRASEDVQARFDDLADKNAAGTLSPEERAEYESLVSGATFISILQAKARALLTHAGH